MRKTLAATIGLLFWCTFMTVKVPLQAASPKVEIGLSNEPWTLAFDAAGFKVNSSGLQPDGRAYLLAENQSTQVTLSVYLEKVGSKATADDCKVSQKNRLAQQVNYKREKIETREMAGMAIVEYTLPEISGVPVQQRNLFACLAKDDVYVDIHLSKTLFKPQEEELLNAVLNSAHFVERIPSISGASDTAPFGAAVSTSLDYFREGSLYFIKQNFSASIPPYQKALDAEKQSRKLPKKEWRVLVDNLGMAYGITGKLAQAEETFNYGVSQDPTYPMFYYNLACVFAGRSDMDKTMEFLRKAFSYKTNMIPNESMPDPRKDDSFKSFMTDQRFREFVNSL